MSEGTQRVTGITEHGENHGTRKTGVTRLFWSPGRVITTAAPIKKKY